MNHPCLVLALALYACGDDASTPDAAVPVPDAAMPDSGGPDGGVLSQDACDRMLGGPAGPSSTFLNELSAAHALVRHFGPEGRYTVVDGALGEALTGEITPEAVLPPYVAAFEGEVCLVDAGASELPAVETELEGEVLVVRPGTGDLVAPAAATTVVVDLRDLSEHPNLAAAIERAVALALSSDVPRARRSIRVHDGYVDEAFSRFNVYTNRLTPAEPAPIAGGGTARTLVLLTGERLAPSAAEIAGTLRLGGHAWLVGADVFAQVAESKWTPIGGRGFAVRVRELLQPSLDRWPDRIPADEHTLDPRASASAYRGRGAPPAVVPTAAERREFTLVHPFDDVSSADLDRGRERAALVITHGVLRLFFPYFHLVGDHIDEALTANLELLETSEETDRRLVLMRALYAMGGVLRDGHVNVLDLELPFSSDLPVRPYAVAAVDGLPVVTGSLTPDLARGDVILEVDGEDTAERTALWRPLAAAATEGYRDYLVASYAASPDDEGPITLVARSPGGAARTVVVDRIAPERYGEVLASTRLHRSGWLADLGAPELYYIDLDETIGMVVPDELGLAAHLDAALGAEGLVLDMRGYPPFFETIDLFARLMDGEAIPPMSRVPHYAGPDEKTWTEDPRTAFTSTGTRYDGPVVLLVTSQTISRAEHIASMLVAEGRATIVGRTSAGTNGNVTVIDVPGHIGLSFTGMEVLNHDGSTFHGVGIVPDVPVALTAQDLHDGVDRDLVTAIDVLRDR